MTNQQLIEAYKDGDNTAIDVFLSRYRSYAIGLAQKILKDIEHAKDCVQIVAEEWLNKPIDKRVMMFTNQNNLLGMLATNIKFRAIDQYRVLYGKRYESLDGVDIAEPEFYDVFEVELKVSQTELNIAILNLESKCMEMAKLKLVPHTRNEIMEIMKINEKEYARIYDKTLRHLRKQLIGIRISRLN